MKVAVPFKPRANSTLADFKGSISSNAGSGGLGTRAQNDNEKTLTYRDKDGNQVTLHSTSMFRICSPAKMWGCWSVRFSPLTRAGCSASCPAQTGHTNRSGVETACENQRTQETIHWIFLMCDPVCARQESVREAISLLLLMDERHVRRTWVLVSSSFHYFKRMSMMYISL